MDYDDGCEFVDEIDEDVVSGGFSKVLREQSKGDSTTTVTYVRQKKVKIPAWDDPDADDKDPREYVSHEELDKAPHILDSGFYEVLNGLKYVRLYFDFDFMKDFDSDKYDELIDSLDSLSKKLGKYSIAGHSNDPRLSSYCGLRWSQNSKKLLSLHVVFYETYVNAYDLWMVMKSKHQKEFWKAFDLVEYDPQVYKLQSGRQTFRHALSPKYSNRWWFTQGHYYWNNKPDPDDAKAKDSVGTIWQDLPVSTQLITPDSLEDSRLRDLSELNEEVFEKIEDEQCQQYMDEAAKEVGQLADGDYKGVYGKDVFNAAMKIIANSPWEIHAHKSDDKLKWISVYRLIFRVVGMFGKNVMAATEKALSARLTDKASEAWESTWEAVVDKYTDLNAGAMIQFLKKIDMKEFTTTIKPLLQGRKEKKTQAETQEEEPKVQPRQVFETSSLTFNDYIEKAGKYKTAAEHQKAWGECIAYSPDGYIVKYLSDEMKSWRYRTYSNSEMKIKMDISCEVKAKAARPKDKKHPEGEWIEEEVTYTIKPMDSLKNTAFRDQYLAYYHRTDLISDDPKVLSRYVPPKGEPNDGMIERFITFMESRVHNPVALHEELSAHAFRFRHPSANIEKVFIHYSHLGKTGKTFFSSAIDLLYGELSMIGIRAQETNSQYNGYMFDYLNLGYEEVENDNYRNKAFETYIKQQTGRKGAVRRMYHDTESGSYRCIVHVNTNSDDLYGLIRGDDAVLSRLCILHFKDPISAAEWNAAKNDFGLNDKAPHYNETKNAFAAAFYHYLRYTYENPHLSALEDYETCRYEGNDKREILAMLRKNSERLPTKFIKKLSIASNVVGVYNDTYAILKRMRDRKLGETVMFAATSSLEQAWNTYVLSLPRGEQGRYTVQAVIDELKRFEWFNKNTKTGKGWAIEEKKYEEWKKTVEGDDEADDDDYLEELDE